MTDPEGSQPEVSAGQLQGRGSNRKQPEPTGSQELGQSRFQITGEEFRRQCEPGRIYPLFARGLSIILRSQDVFAAPYRPELGPVKKDGGEGVGREVVFGHDFSDGTAATSERPGPGRQRRSPLRRRSFPVRPPLRESSSDGVNGTPHPGRSLRPGSLP